VIAQGRGDGRARARRLVGPVRAVLEQLAVVAVEDLHEVSAALLREG
jgi:hypothetical protein